jgi:hypothetical protein
MAKAGRLLNGFALSYSYKKEKAGLKPAFSLPNDG